MSEPAQHPDPHELSAFSLGQLSQQAAQKIEQHISECQPCCETMLNLSTDDTFVHMLQSAKRPVTDSEIPAPRNTHPRYEVEQVIGCGGMGQVYKARHRMMDRTVALKIINREWVQNQKVVERFHREVRAAASLTHPNIVTAYDAEQAGELHFLVMEYVDGVDLAQTVKERGPLPFSQACDYIWQAAEGLQHAHQAGMVHRDIKPHNLMITKDNVVKILDFGLASLVPQSASGEGIGEDGDGNLTIAGAIMGTPDFISPEQAQDASRVDGRSDIYSLGMTLYFLLAGRVPFREGAAMTKLKLHAECDPPPLESLRDDLPRELLSVVSRMIAKNPDERFQSPRDVANALEPFVNVDGHPLDSQQPNVFDYAISKASMGAGDGGYNSENAFAYGEGSNRWQIWAVWLGCLLVGVAVAFILPIGLPETFLLIFGVLIATTVHGWLTSSKRPSNASLGFPEAVAKPAPEPHRYQWLKYLGELFGIIAFVPIALMCYEWLYADDVLVNGESSIWYYIWPSIGLGTLAGLAQGAYQVKTFYPDLPFRHVMAFTALAVVVTTCCGFYFLRPNEPYTLTAGGAGVDGNGWYLSSGGTYLRQGEPAVLFGMYEDPQGGRGFTYVVLLRCDGSNLATASRASEAGLTFDGEQAFLTDGITIDGKGIKLDLELLIGKQQIESANFYVNGNRVDALSGNLFLVDVTADHVDWKRVSVQFPDHLPEPRLVVGDTEIATEVAQRLTHELTNNNETVREFLNRRVNMVGQTQTEAKLTDSSSDSTTGQQPKPKLQLSEDLEKNFIRNRTHRENFEQELYVAISEAAGIPKDQWEGITKGGGPEKIPGTPLSKFLLTDVLVDRATVPSVASPSDFQLLTGSMPKPLELHKAMTPAQPRGAVSLIQPEYIKKIELGFDRKAGKFKGTLLFEVPKLIAGKIAFTMYYQSGQSSAASWLKIDEFQLPILGLKFVRGSRLWEKRRLPGADQVTIDLKADAALENVQRTIRNYYAEKYPMFAALVNQHSKSSGTAEKQLQGENRQIGQPAANSPVEEVSNSFPVMPFVTFSEKTQLSQTEVLETKVNLYRINDETCRIVVVQQRRHKIDNETSAINNPVTEGEIYKLVKAAKAGSTTDLNAGESTSLPLVQALHDTERFTAKRGKIVGTFLVNDNKHGVRSDSISTAQEELPPAPNLSGDTVCETKFGLSFDGEKFPNMGQYLNKRVEVTG